VRYKSDSIEERDAAVERLREFLRFKYVTGSQVARRIGVRDTTLYSWPHGKSRPRSAAAVRVITFLESLPVERVGIMPTGYESGVQELARDSESAALSVLQAGKRRDPEGEEWVSGLLSSIWATGPKREDFDEALMAWNGKDSR
jgi:hypothetical protein